MLNLITNQQMRQADTYTCQHLNIESVELMEQAAKAFVELFIKYSLSDKEISIVAGKGNNGGDGLAIARLLHEKGYKHIKVYILEKFNSASKDFSINLEKLQTLNIPIVYCYSLHDLPSTFDVVVDAVLGSGFNRALDSFFAAVFRHINESSNFIVSVDVPSGCPADTFDIESYDGIHAHLTICFQRPKLFFTLPESHKVTDDFKTVSIGLCEDYLQSIPSDYFWIDKGYVTALLPCRKKFSHKGSYGHVLVYSGAKTMRGASLLASKAAVKMGAGRTTLLTDAEFFPFANVFLPELMTADIGRLNDLNFDKFSAIAIGPGLGISETSREHVLRLLKLKNPLVLDADALNVLSKEDLSGHPHLVITPHMNEFDRLFGKHKTWYERLQSAKSFAQENGIVIVLKNQYTFICTPQGKVFINSTGNPAMAQGGMGDVLTGCITALLARGLKPEEAAVAGCYIHGFTADLLAEQHEVVSPSLLTDNLSKAISLLKSGPHNIN